ncbi:unnamed protein product [Nesidiocoris tenuis]|uniref:Uncharacterized protein n=1 Tax=Nesidiocoris tenuis TaxID=355587 RepID=A0A6H5G786_9HEMI|nr:unnamed protein product [Nesidiocoris tenuis]
MFRRQGSPAEASSTSSWIHTNFFEKFRIYKIRYIRLKTHHLQCQLPVQNPRQLGRIRLYKNSPRDNLEAAIAEKFKTQEKELNAAMGLIMNCLQRHNQMEDLVKMIRQKWMAHQCRKFVITLLLVLVLIKFWYGYIYVVDPNQIARGPVSIQRCLDDRLLPFYHEEEEGNANIYYDVPATEGQENIGFLPLVGNGLFALTMTQSPSLYVKKSRTLSLSVGWSPLVRLVPQYGSDSSEAMVTHFVTGIVHLYNCYSNGLLTSNYIYAHRSRSNILVQEIRIVNPTDETIPLRLVDPVNDVWPSAMKRSVRQANSLWKDLKTFKEVNDAVSLWLLTLEKQGCHKLIITGAFGVLQAMILSFGGFRFSSQHLEFKIDPKFLHRDYLFRRIRYNDRTCINVTVTLQDDNKAQLGVALDRSDKPYYACDGGCIDEPVQLKSTPVYFPVKVTDPITSILYITSDRSHMELIKDTLHVHKIVEAPAYDHHVIALHKHGHHLGGLPVLFWASICFLIIVFHLFLFKLIFNEYCDKQDRHKARYGKMSL